MMLGKLFKKKEDSKHISLYAPINGETVPLEEVPDPVFSEEMMGNGIAIKPSDELVTAPVDGKVIQLFSTKHAVGILAENGAEILIHIGIDTVELQGEGFTAYVEEGDHVKKGDKLVAFNYTTVETKAKSTLIPIIITNTDEMSEISPIDKKSVRAGEDIVLSIEK